MASLIALAAMLLLAPSKAEAAQTHTITFDALGGQKGNLDVREGDTVVFKNNLPLAPLTGGIVPVRMTLGAESFSVGGTPVVRTITRSVSYSGTYAVLGLVPLTSTSGTITVAGTPPPPPPPPAPVNPPPPASPPPPGDEEPNDPGNGTTPSTPGGTGPNIPGGDPGTVPGGAGTGTTPGATPGGGGQAPPAVVAPADESGKKTTLVPGADSQGNRAMTNAGSTAGGLGLIAMLGAVLLLGVGMALARTLISGRLNTPVTG